MFSPVIPPFFAISCLRLQGRENVLRREKTQQKMQKLCYCVLVKGATLKKEKAQ